MTESLEKCAGNKYKVILRTSTLPHSAEIAGALMVNSLTKITSIAIEEMWARIKHAHQVEALRAEAGVNLFKEAQNADYVLGAVRPDGLEPPWADNDIKAAINMLTALRGLFFDVADAKDIYVDDVKKQTLAINEAIDVERNHILFCRTNPIVSWALGIEEEVPCDGLNQDRRNKLLENLVYKFSIIDNVVCIRKGDEEMYPPIYNKSLEIYDKDYLMILKIPSLFMNSRGNVDFVIAGCHKMATEGIGIALENEDILESMNKEIGTSPFFQAIIEIHSGIRKESDFSKLKSKVSAFMSRNIQEKYSYIPMKEPQMARYVSAVPLFPLL